MLEKQIKAEEFSQTTGGKVFNTIGKFGERMTRPKKTTSSSQKSPHSKKKNKKTPARVSLKEMMAKLPQ